MELLTKEFFEKSAVGTEFTRVALIKDYSKKVTRTGKDFLDGQLQFGQVVSFKVWSNSNAIRKMITEDYTNTPCAVSGVIEEYEGNRTITIKDVNAVEGYTPDMFFEVRYQQQAYVDALNNELNRVLSDKGKQVRDIVMTPEVCSRFYEEFAAMKYHDNCKSGLLAHTFKMVCILGWVVQTYPMLVMDYDEVNKKYVPSKDRLDLIYLGVVLHDIGKIIEMNFGTYQRNSFVGHTFFGAEMIAKHREEIVNLYGEDWYYQLASVLLQHHDEYETPCKTVLSFVVHNIDKLESTLTGLCQQMESSTMLDSTGARVKWDNKILTI